MSVETLEAEVVRLRYALMTLVAWLPQSSPAPLTREEAKRILAIIDGSKFPGVHGRYLQQLVPDEKEPRE